MAGGRIVSVGERGHIIYSENDGKTWTQADSPTSETLTAVFFLDDQRGWAVGHGMVILYTGNGGINWIPQHRDPAADQPLFDVLFLSPEKGIAIGAYGAVMITKDGGRTWRKNQVDPTFDRHLYALAKRANDVFAVGESGAVIKSSDGGASWKILPPPGSSSLFGLLVLSDGHLLVYGMNGKSSLLDAEEKWKEMPRSTDASLFGSAVLKSGNVMLTGAGGRVLMSWDKGRTFSMLSAQGNSAVSSILETPAGTVLLFGDAGVRTLELNTTESP